ncbi:hydroxymethylglutaryl-CoA synthase family protein [Amycolatopsis alba]|uniref:hydroxymethylglutaryl-CoA synthase family protein n=1 Tax=Amycolatopsis alba TaxID=76020 RepID=UPI00037DDC12|nr:hydroxymethylglutaryl-CoA synthase [Amycolatopsis alba]
MSTGIEAINVYCGLARIPVRALFEGRGLDLSRLGNIMMTERSVQLPFEDPVTNAVNAAKPLLDTLSQEERDRIELLVTSTESGLDYSKSIASYVHGQLGLSRNCRLLEVKQACYGATAMVQLAAGFLPPGAKALIIATDITVLDAGNGYAEPATGHGAAAILVSDRPSVMTLDPGAAGLCGFDIMDTSRPTPTLDLWDADRSLLSYLECLEESFKHYAHRVPGTDFSASFEHLAFHTPFAGMVKAAHRRMARKFAPGLTIVDDFERRLLPSLTYPRLVGNLSSGSLYLALCSVIDTAPEVDDSPIGLYSYGSGCSSEFFSGRVQASARTTVGRMRIADRLRDRQEIDFSLYSRLLDETHECLVPKPDRQIDLLRWQDFLGGIPDRPPTLALGKVDHYHRHYEWL